MNRIQQFQTTAELARVSVDCEQNLGHRQTAANPIAHFLPSGFTPRYEYPLIVWLHHHGGNERDVSRVLPHVSLQNFIGVGVRGGWATESSGNSYGWSDTPSGSAVAEQLVFDAIESTTGRYAINPQKIFLVGYNEGGSAALRIGMRHPDRFAGAVSLGGALPQGGRLMGNIKQLRSLPVLLATFRESVKWPVEDVCRDLRLLHAARMRVDVRQYPEMGELCTRILSDLNRWLMERVTGMPMSEAEESLSFSNN